MRLIDCFKYPNTGCHHLSMVKQCQGILLNYQSDNALEKIDTFRKDEDTDSVFILSYGEVVLVAMRLTLKRKNMKFETIYMLPNAVYRVRRGIWYQIVLTKNSKVLELKNSVATKNCEFYQLDDQQKKILKRHVLESMCKTAVF